MNIEDLRFNTIYNLYELNSFSLTDKDIELLHNYIEELDKKELEIFYKLMNEFIHFKNYCGHKKYKITNNAIRLAIKISDQISIKVFPYIERIAKKSWSVSDGTFSWGMYILQSNKGMVGCYDKVNECLKSKSVLEWYNSTEIGNKEIMIR